MKKSLQLFHFILKKRNYNLLITNYFTEHEAHKSLRQTQYQRKVIFLIFKNEQKDKTKKYRFNLLNYKKTKTFHFFSLCFSL